jgi:hypothetical protein
LYHKIRIPLKQILEIISDFYEIPSAALSNESAKKSLKLPWIWDVRLALSNEFKSEIAELSNKIISPEVRIEILTKSLPKFLWRATATSEDGSKLIDLLFDATDIVHGESLSCVIEYDQTIGEFLSWIPTVEGTEKRKFQRRSSWPILQQLQALQAKA